MKKTRFFPIFALLLLAATGIYVNNGKKVIVK